MTYLITGAAGFIGFHLAKTLLESGHEVWGLDSFTDYYDVDLKRNRIASLQAMKCKFHLLEQDIADEDCFIELEQISFDGLIHLAAQAGVRYSIENPRDYAKSNLLGFTNVLEFVRKGKVKNFLFASSSSVYGKSKQQPLTESININNPASFYAATKVANEIMARSYYNLYGIDSIGMRFFTVYGPWGRPDMAPYIFLSSVLSEKRIQVFNNGNQSRDFTFIDDIVNYICGLLNLKLKGCNIFNLGNGSPQTLMDFIHQIELKTNKKADKILVPEQKGDVKDTWADTSKIDSVLGVRKKIPIDEGLDRYIEWFKNYYL